MKKCIFPIARNTPKAYFATKQKLSVIFTNFLHFFFFLLQDDYCIVHNIQFFSRNILRPPTNGDAFAFSTSLFSPGYLEN